MKVLRSFPVIATAILGLIALGLYKTSSFINTKVAIESQLSLDSLAASPSVIVPTIDTFAAAQNQLQTPAFATDSNESVATKLSETAELESTISAANVAETTDKSQLESGKKGAKVRGNKSPKSANKAANKGSGKTVDKAAAKVPEVPRFHVVVGTYKVEKNAKSEALILEKKTGKKATVLKNKGFYRVSASDFSSEKEASDAASKLKEAGNKCLVLKF